MRVVWKSKTGTNIVRDVLAHSLVNAKGQKLQRTPKQNKQCHVLAKILQIGMIPHNMTLFKFVCVQYQIHGQTLPIMKIDRGQIQFREYVSTGTEPTMVNSN